MWKFADRLPPATFGLATLRWSLVLIFALFGIAKFAAYEAEGVAQIAMGYPLFAWMYPLIGGQGASNVIGVIELAAGALIALGAWSHRAGLVGALMGVCTFLITLSFALGAPLWEPGYGFPFMGAFAQFLFKDAVLLAGCVTLALHAGHALREQAGAVA